MADDTTNLVWIVGIVLEVEKKLGEQFQFDEFSHEEIEQTKTLRDVARGLETHLPPVRREKANMTDLAIKAARETWRCTADELPLDVPVIDAIDPMRWERRSKRWLTQGKIYDD